MNAEVQWKGRMSFTGAADSGFEVPLGSSPEVGGDNDGFRPMELIYRTVKNEMIAGILSKES